MKNWRKKIRERKRERERKGEKENRALYALLL